MVTPNELLYSLVQLVCNGDFDNAEKQLADLKRLYKADNLNLADIDVHYEEG